MDGWAIVSIDQAGVILSVDKACSALLGYSLDELVGNKINMIIPPPYKEQHDMYMQQYLSTGIKRIIGKAPRVVEAVTKAGKFLAVSLHVTEMTVPETGERRFLGVLQPCEENNSVLTINATNGEIVSAVNTRALGYQNSSALTGKAFSVLVPPPFQRRMEEYLRDAGKSGTRTRNVPLMTGSGQIISVSMAISEMSFGDALQMFRVEISLVDCSIQLMFSVSATGQIQTANHNFVLTLLGYDNEEVCNMSFNDLVPGTFKDGELAISLGDRVDMVARHADGSQMEVAVQALSFMTPTGDSSYSIRVNRSNCDASSLSGGSVSGDELGSSRDGNDPVRVASYELGEELGRGMYGRVLKGCHVTTKDLVAIKLVYVTNKEDVHYKRAQREVTINQRLQHPSIVRMMEVVETDRYLAIVMEFIAGGSLASRLQQVGSISEAECKYFMRQVLSALAYMHGMGVVHRDIKHSNVMIQPNPDQGHPGAPWVGSVAKLIDFGLSTFSEKDAFLQSYCGTPAYAAPEMLRGEDYAGTPVDMWSLGVCMFKGLTAHFPFGSVSEIMAGKLEYPVALSPACTDVLARLLRPDPSQRPSAELVAKHPWFSRALAAGGSVGATSDEGDDEEEEEEIIEVECEVRDASSSRGPQLKRARNQ